MSPSQNSVLVHRGLAYARKEGLGGLDTVMKEVCPRSISNAGTLSERGVFPAYLGNQRTHGPLSEHQLQPPPDMASSCSSLS